jgi:hypothetical protein
MEKHAVRRVCLGVMLLLLASGCAGIVNPHIKWDPPAGNIPDATALTLDYAIKYADSARAAYKNALGNQSQLASWLGIGLIPIAATALGLGMSGNSPGAITVLGLTTASGYAVGTWLYSKPNQRAWVVGYNATTCAVEAILPLLYVEKNWEKEIKTTLEMLNSAVVPVEAGIGDVRKQLLLIGKEPPPDLVDLKEFAEQRVKEAEQLLASSYETRGKAEKMRQEASTAGVSLKEAVDRISGQVSAQIVETGPDIQALALVIGGLAQSYGQFVRVPEGLRPAVPPSAKGQAKVEKTEDKEKPIVKQDEALRNALGNLEAKMISLQGVSIRVAEIVNGVTTSKPIEKLRACGVNPEQIAQPLTVDPSGRIEFEAGKAATVGRVIRGGSAPYAVALQGDAEGPVVRQTEPFGPAFTIQITDKTPAKEYSIYISDKAGQRLFIPVDVKSGTVGKPSIEDPYPKAAAGLNRDKPSFELQNPDVNVKIVKAEATGGILGVVVEIKAKIGPTTQAILDKINDDKLKEEILKIKLLKDYGIDKREKINVTKKMAST